MLLLVVLALLVVEARFERMSGLYVDNGFDQTIVQRWMTKQQQREVKHEILDLLGLPEPLLKHRSSSEDSSQVKRSVPKFLKDIYKMELENGNHGGDNRKFDLVQNMMIDQSDTITTFAAHSLPAMSAKFKQGKRLWFNVSDVPVNELVLGAELRLYHSLNAGKTIKNRKPFTLTAYRMLIKDDVRKLQYIDSVNVSSGHEGWINLNVSSALNHWLQNPLENQGLYLSLHQVGRPMQEVKPENNGFQELSGGVERQPFMVAFFKSSGPQLHNIHQRRGIKRNKRSSNLNVDFKINPYVEPQMQRSSQRACQMRSLYVSFKDLKWQDWIIAPDGYDAYYCSGECNFPLNAHMNATNHAIVQSLVHVMYPGKVPKPCCAPTKLSALTVMYYSGESNITLKKYKDMVVKNCGCH